LVTVEVALGVLLMTGAGLLFRTLVHLQAASYGYDTANLLTMKVAVSGPDYRPREKLTRFYDDVISRLRAVPGVRDAAAISFIPLHGVPAGTGVVIEGEPDPGPGNGPSASIRVVTPGYFELARIPMVQGRSFDAADNRPESPYRFIVNEAFARKYLRGSPGGRRISVHMDNPNPFGEIVGVSADVSDGPRESRHDPTVYYVHAHLAFSSMMVLLRTAGAPEAAILPAQQVVRAVEPRATVSEIAPMAAVLGEVIGRERFSASLLAVFSGFALLLTAIGIYGVLAYTVSERTREIGVRVALGAEPPAITGMFAAKALRFTLVGACAGTAAALTLSRFLQSLLYETSARDPIAFAGSALILIAVALLAACVPSMRAALMNPTEALRMD
jgi:predicted permease